MKVIIAEKPLVADAIADVLGATKANGYHQKDSTIITWSYGHLVGLAMPDDYDESLKKWSKESLPILPEQFKLKLSDDPGIKKQFQTVKDFLTEADEIICATDNDREGDLIFHYIYSLSGCQKPYRRILPNDLTETGVKKWLDKEIDPRYDVIKSAECRSESDWLIGINATRAITVSSNQKITIGRVQTPTLSLIVERWLENKNFKPEPYYPISIQLEKDGIKFIAKIETNPTNEVDAKAIIDGISSTSECTFSERKQVEEKQPLPYYLSTLQMDASNKLGFTSKQTLDLAQSLYEKHRLTTYPRTDSGYLTTGLFEEMPDLLKKLMDMYNQDKINSVINLDNLPTTCINDKKAPNHHGIIPTNNLNAYSNLNANEKKLFDLIANRFLAAFADKCIKDKTKYQFMNNELNYVSTGSVTVSPGWRAIYLEEKDEQDEETENSSDLPSVNTGDSLPTTDPKYVTKLTKAPPLLTHSSIIQQMKSAGNKLDDKELKKAMSDNELRTGGLGTEATRGSIVDTLFSVSLVTLEKKNIVPTEMGLSLYEQIKHLDIAKPDLTAKWELKLDQIASGEFDSTTFIDEIKEYTSTVTKELLQVGSKVDTYNLKLTCPKCSSGKIIEGKKGFGCSRWNDESDPCNFVIWKQSYGKTLTINHVQELIENKRTKSMLKGLSVPSSDKKFDAFLILNDDFKVKAQFDSGETFTCPICKGNVKVNQNGAFCENDDLKIFRNIAKKKLTDSHLKQLLEKGKTGEIKGFTSKGGKPFDAMLVLDGDKVTFKFADKKK